MEKNHPRILEALTTQPWLCSEEGMRQMLAVASYEGDIEALKVRMEQRDPEAFKTSRRGDVAIIPLSGPIFPKANLMTNISGATALSEFAADFQAAEDDLSVDTILIDINSPGGVIDGIHEAASMIRSSSTKVIGYVGATAASAAYWLAAATDEIVVDATARLGSIGVVAGIRPKQEGDPIEFTNTASPNKRLDMESKEGQAQLIEQLDALADVFIEDVAAMRNVSAKTVTKDFGQGGMLVGQAAVEAGMADRLGSYEALIQELTNTKRGGTNMDFAALTKEDLMAKRQDLVTAIAAEAVSAVEATHAEALSGVSAQVETLTEENTALKAQNEALQAENTENGDRLVALEKKDALREEQALEAQATGIINARIGASTIPERLHSKVVAGISKDKYIADGKLDVKGFTAHVDSECSDWEESIGAAGGPIQGIGATNRSDGEDVDTSEDDSIVDRMLNK